MPEKYRYIGKPTRRKDANDIVTGKNIYLDDFCVPRMLYGKCLRSPFPHARIGRIDTSKAKQLKGVRAILTYEDVPKEWKAGLPPHRLVLDQTVRFVGDGVALVAADTPEIAEEALDLIEVSYEPLKPVFDLEEALKPGAPQLYGEFPGNELTPGCPLLCPGPPFYQLKRGDTEKGFAESDVIIEGVVAYDKFPSALPPEAPAVIAAWETENELTLWGTTQSVNLMKGLATVRMNFPKIRGIAHNVGGSYGNKHIMAMPIFYAAALAKATKRPVKYALTKSEQLLTHDLRLGSKIKARIGMTKDGQIKAIQGVWLVDTGMSSDFAQAQISVALGEAQIAISKCENWDLDTKLVVTNRCPSGVVRGFGGQELKSALVLLWSQAMQKAGVDPFECIKNNYVEAGGGYFWRDGIWYTCREVNYKKALEETAERFGWKEKWKGWHKPTSVNGSKVTGVGVSIHGNADAGEDDSEAYVRLEGEGTVVIQCNVVETGMGQKSSLAKMVAEILQVPLENIKFSVADSLANPGEFGLAGSRGTLAVGTSCTKAAIDAKKKLLEMAAPVMGAAPEELDTIDCFVFVKENPEKRMPWIEIIPHVGSVTGLGTFHADYTTPNCFIIFTEVEVDLETGQAKILKVTGGSDVGQVIDPIQLEMQYHGSFGSAGTDTGLFEESVLDTVTGRVLTGNMIDYKWRPFNEFPEFDAVMAESQFDLFEFKAIGCGEVSGAAGPSAVMMAISNAIGTNVTEYPARPDVILKALSKKPRGEAGI